MIMQPDVVTKQIFTEALAQAQKKKGLPKLRQIRFEIYDEGLVGQFMHIGPFSAEGPNIQKIHEYILENGKKPNQTLIVNADDAEKDRFLSVAAPIKKTYSAKDGEPYEIKKEGIDFTWRGQAVSSPLSGLFNLYNIIAAASCAEALEPQSANPQVIKRAIEKFNGIRGRVEKIEAGQDFAVIVDYAHTVDSLEKLYQVFQSSRKIAVLGGTGGGRDTWRRTEMGKLADQYCEEVILTNEDPYDDDPMEIINDVAKGVSSKKPTIILDRRVAIAEALKKARTGDVVLVTGKGTDPYIMGPDESKVPWDDATVVREELAKLAAAKSPVAPTTAAAI